MTRASPSAIVFQLLFLHSDGCSLNTVGGLLIRAQGGDALRSTAAPARPHARIRLERPGLAAADGYEWGGPHALTERSTATALPEQWAVGCRRPVAAGRGLQRRMKSAVELTCVHHPRRRGCLGLLGAAATRKDRLRLSDGEGLAPAAPYTAGRIPGSSSPCVVIFLGSSSHVPAAARLLRQPSQSFAFFPSSPLLRACSAFPPRDAPVMIVSLLRARARRRLSSYRRHELFVAAPEWLPMVPVGGAGACLRPVAELYQHHRSWL